MVKKKRKRNEQPEPDGTGKVELTLKERLAQKRKAERLRKELIVFTALALLFAAVVGFLVGLTSGIKPAIGVTVGLLCTTLSFKYPRQALWAFLIYLPFGGTITYLIGNSPLLQLAKDGFYIPALFGVVQYCRREQLPVLVPKGLVPPLLILLTFCLLTLTFVNGSQQLNPAEFTLGEEVLLENPLGMGILGLKVLIGYIPLIICGYYLIRNRKDLMFLMRLTVVLVLIACGLAFVQYLLLQNGSCDGTRFEEGSDLFKASLQARCFVGGALLYSPEHGQIRLPGTFVAPWQWGWFLISAGFLAFAPAFNDPKPFWRTLSLVSLGSVVVMSVLSGQRIALGIVPVALISLLILTGQIIYLKRFLPTAVVLGALLSFIAVSNPAILQERIESFQNRWNASPPTTFIMNQFGWAISSQEGFLGNGLGRATNSARSLGNTQLIETYYPKMIYEIGIFGTLAFLVFVTTLVFLTFRAYRSVRDTSLRPYGAAIWLFVLFISYNTYYYPLDVDPVAVYYWFFAGVVLKLPEIERQEKREALEQAKPVEKKKRLLQRSQGFS
ncbi:MAG: hormogonium polysaccharide biosynthesis protein HpsL [Oculatellaceae cyanobacterium bins.114]|nr:hormogonium polysaccharide biosynthesis protein HpsL [Oculatellaceae cyanobacterium bins.114]